MTSETKASSQKSTFPRRKRKAYGVLQYRKTMNTNSFFRECHRMFSEMLACRGGLLLIWFTWPIAVITMIVAHLKRIWHLGTMYPNAAHMINTGAPPSSSNQPLSKHTDSNFSSSHDTNVIPAMDPRLKLSALELARKIRDPQDSLTSCLLTELCIAQIKRVDPYLRAVVATRFEQARAEAAAADNAIAANPQEIFPTFFGVPLVIKEVFEVKGMPYTAGLVGRKGVLGQVTGPVVKQVQESTGAIVLASTNISEACMWHESANHVYGSTNNPYDFSRTAGGSSGGCGAAVASCMVPVSIASDVGGSIRIPALYNGLFGHKPTGGLVSNAHTFPEVGTGDIQRFCQLGPLTRCSEDLWPLLVAMKTRSSESSHQNTQTDNDIDNSIERLDVGESLTDDGANEGLERDGWSTCKDPVDTTKSSLNADALSSLPSSWHHADRNEKRDCSESDISCYSDDGGDNVLFEEEELVKQSSEELLTVDFTKLVVYYTKRNLGSSLFISALHPDVSVGMDAALAYLEQQGATLIDFDEEESVKDMFSGLNAFRIWSSLMSKHRHQPFSVTIREGLGVEKATVLVNGDENAQHGALPTEQISFFAAFVELLKSLVDMSYNTFPAMLLAFVEFISDLPLMESENEKQCADGLRIKEELEYLLSPEYRIDDIKTEESGKVDGNDMFKVDSTSIDSELDKNSSVDETEVIRPNFTKVRKLSREHVLLMPSLPTPAPFHAESIMRVFDTSNTAFFNVMQLPVTAVPLGLSKPRSSVNSSTLGEQRRSARRQTKRGSQKRGQLLPGASNLPVGMQIVGGPNRDHVTIGIALALERAGVAGWVPPVAK